MNKYSIAAIFIAILIGISVGWFGKTTVSNKEVLELQKRHELELVKQNKKAEANILQLNNIILDLKSDNVQDSITISALKYKISKDGVVVESKIKELQNRTYEEKLNYLDGRYSNHN